MKTHSFGDSRWKCPLKSVFQLLLFQILFLSSVVTSTCPSGYTFESSVDGCYMVVSTTMTWSNAASNCVANGGWLAVPDDATENNYIGSLISSETWMGLTDSASEGTWIRSDNGEVATYYNWSPGEPNNDGNQDCVKLYTTYRWDDDYCTKSKASICEADISAFYQGIIELPSIYNLGSIK